MVGYRFVSDIIEMTYSLYVISKISLTDLSTSLHSTLIYIDEIRHYSRKLDHVSDHISAFLSSTHLYQEILHWDASAGE